VINKVLPPEMYKIPCRVAGILWTLVIDLGNIIIPRLRVAGILWTLVIDLGKLIIPRIRVAGILWTPTIYQLPLFLV
jgi:hypothetical protein